MFFAIGWSSVSTNDDILSVGPSQRPVLVSFAAIAWARHATLPPLGEGALRDELKQRLRRRLDRCWFMDFL